jgi:hypothetical protein
VPEGTVVFPVAAVEGAALIFAQNLPHEGEPVDEGCTKYIIRTDAMYEPARGQAVRQCCR